MSGLGNGGAAFGRLRTRAPQARANRHCQEFAIRSLFRPRFASDLIFLGEPWVEHSAKLDVAGMAAGRDDEPFLSLDVHILIVGSGGDAKHSPGSRIFADDTGQFVTKQEGDSRRRSKIKERRRVMQLERVLQRKLDNAWFSR